MPTEVTCEADVISVIITILNGAKWIDKCFESIVRQTAVQQQQHHQQQQEEKESHNEAQNPLVSHLTTMTSPSYPNSAEYDKSNKVSIEVCVFDDCSFDETAELLRGWQRKMREQYQLRMRIIENESGTPKGVGYGRNKAIEAATGNYLCFQDIDDEMLPERIHKQYELAKSHRNAIIGCKFTRIPGNATCRYTRWANELATDKLMLQIYTANGPTVIMPTWMCSRSVYEQVEGGFCEDGRGTPEDLIFFYKHLDNGGRIFRVDECLLKYRYHMEATTFQVTAPTIWRIRLRHLIEHQLSREPWCRGFTIWNAGKQGRRFFRDLPAVVKARVNAFCDVDKNKINKNYNYFDVKKRQTTYTIPIVHFREARPPLVICMKLDLTNGDFETNLQSLNLVEGKHYILFT